MIDGIGMELPYAVVEWADAKWGRTAAWTAAVIIICLPFVVIWIIVEWAGS